MRIGRYDVIRPLDHQPRSYRAWDSSTRQAVVVLGLPADANPNRVERFLAAGRLAAANPHPHIAATLEVIERPDPFIVVEYAIGESLADRIRTRPLMRPADITAQVAGLAEAMAFARARGMQAHPFDAEQAIVGPDGVVRWMGLDFGDGDEPRAAGGAASEAADLAILAAALYDLLAVPAATEATGRPPLARVRPDLEPAAAALADRWLSVDVASASLTAFAAELRHLSQRLREDDTAVAATAATAAQAFQPESGSAPGPAAVPSDALLLNAIRAQARLDRSSEAYVAIERALGEQGHASFRPPSEWSETPLVTPDAVHPADADQSDDEATRLPATLSATGEAVPRAEARSSPAAQPFRQPPPAVAAKLELSPDAIEIISFGSARPEIESPPLHLPRRRRWPMVAALLTGSVVAAVMVRTVADDPERSPASRSALTADADVTGPAASNTARDASSRAATAPAADAPGAAAGAAMASSASAPPPSAASGAVQAAVTAAPVAAPASPPGATQPAARPVKARAAVPTPTSAPPRAGTASPRRAANRPPAAAAQPAPAAAATARASSTMTATAGQPAVPAAPPVPVAPAATAGSASDAAPFLTVATADGDCLDPSAFPRILICESSTSPRPATAGTATNATAPAAVTLAGRGAAGAPAAGAVATTGTAAAPRGGSAAAPIADGLPAADRDSHAAELVTFVRPVYPEAAKAAKLTGAVEVDITIDATGRVATATAISGPVPLRQSAETAVLQWRFRPAQLDGRPVSSRRRFLISFAAVTADAAGNR